jgi:DNA (cytosine-5)-methyltransferase 1
MVKQNGQRTGAGPTAYVATAFHQTQDPISGEEFTPALGVTSVGMGLKNGTDVRRLTPTECERLQGLPDGWTQLGSTPDSRRYSALGDAVTATVGEWIGRRLACA